MTYGHPGVYINETLLPAPVAAAGTANAAGAAIGAFAQGPTGVTLVTSWYDFVQKYGSFSSSFPATFGVNQFFVNGGSELYVKRVLGAGADVADAVIPPASGVTNLGTVASLDKGDEMNNLRIQITGTSQANYYTLVVYKEIVAEFLNTASTNATNDVIVEQFTNIRFDDNTHPDYAETVVNSTSNYIRLTLTAEGTPATQAVDAVIPLTGGTDGAAPVVADYEAVFATDGTSELDYIQRPLVVFTPGLYEKFVVDGNADAGDDLAVAHEAMLAWANVSNGFAVLDTAPGQTVAQAIAYSTARTPVSAGAVYYPHYFMQDPLSRTNGALRKVSPAGAVAGVFLRTDKSDGPFKTPAGVNASIRSAVSLERAFTPAELDSLNTGVYVVADEPVYGTPVNAIRNVPGAGVVVMGGRTLLQDGTANRYVNTRRSLIYIKKQMENLTQFAIFRNNDHKLWQQLRTTLEVFLNEYRNQGGLKGTSASQAFWIQVDSTNNTPATIATGVVNISVGVALQYPAEFVVINLSQITGN